MQFWQQGSDSTINASKWLNNILPAPKGEAHRDEDVGGGGGGSGDSTPPAATMVTPQKPVNLLPEVPTNQSRQLSQREQRDCEVIGEFVPTPSQHGLPKSK